MRRLYELDAIRGVAALVVFAHHWLTLTGHAQGLGPLPGFAVDLFFILSGFVMARTYEPKMRDGSLSVGGFLVIRYRRLFMPLAIGSSIGLLWTIVALGFSTKLAASYLLNLVFLPSLYVGNAFLLNVPAWSLFLEIVANALHGRWLFRCSTRALTWTFALSVTGGAMLLAAGFGRWDYSLVSIVSCLPRELAFYLLGIVVFRRWGDGFLTMRPSRAASWIGAASYPLYAVHMPILSFVVQFSPSLAIVLALGCGGAIAFVERPATKPRTPSALPA